MFKITNTHRSVTITYNSSHVISRHLVDEKTLNNQGTFVRQRLKFVQASRIESELIWFLLATALLVK